MKSNKAKQPKKTEKTSSRKAARKDLESGITDKFLDVIKGLGHDVKVITKDIRKVSKQLAKKLAGKFSEPASETLPKGNIKAQTKPAPASSKGLKAVAKKDFNKAEKVVAKVAKNSKAASTGKQNSPGAGISAVLESESSVQKTARSKKTKDVTSEKKGRQIAEGTGVKQASTKSSKTTTGLKKRTGTAVPNDKDMPLNEHS